MTVPAHVAIIMDGNGRWARQRGKMRHSGHQAGEQNTRRIVEACAGRGVSMLTLFAFSSENWKRPTTEVSKLMDLFVDSLGSQVQDLHENGIRLSFIGDRTRFSAKLQQAMAAAESLTASNTRMQVNVAVSYGGRWELVEAARRVARAVRDEGVDPDTIDENSLIEGLCIPPGAPEPDLFIRTGGERRLSNFLLWHLAYTELYFTDTLWPDFNAEELDIAFAWFGDRDRRFGGVKDA